MKRCLALFVVLFAVVIASAAMPSLAAASGSWDVLSTNANSAPGWTNTPNVVIDTGTYYGYLGCYVSTDGGATWSDEIHPVPDLIPVTIGSENRAWDIGFRVWVSNGNGGWTTVTNFDSIKLDTVKPTLRAHMSKTSYARTQRPSVHYFVQDKGAVKTSAVVRRSGTKVGTSRPAVYRTPWYWRTLPLFANTSSTFFRRGTYRVTVTARDKAGNIARKLLSFSVY